MNKDNITKYNLILDQWYKNVEDNGREYCVKKDDIIPSPLEYFFHWFLTQESIIHDLALGLRLTTDKYYFILRAVERARTHSLYVSVFDADLRKDESYDDENVTIVLRKDNLCQEICNQLKDLSVAGVKLSDFFANDESKRIDCRSLDHDISQLYKLPIITSDYKQLMYDLKKINIKATVRSQDSLIQSKQFEYIASKKGNETKLLAIVNSYLKFKTKVGRLYKVQSKYIIHHDDYLEIELKMTIRFYSNEIYYDTYGYYEAAIHNLCNKGIGYSTENLNDLARELQVDIMGLSNEEICKTLWNAFHTLNTK